MKCPICDDNTKSPIIAALWHFRLIDFDQWAYVRGTWQTFGFRAVLTLVSPICNTLINWKHRKARLELETPRRKGA
jgi:hypothetical protein